MYREGVKKANVCAVRTLVVALLLWGCLANVTVIVAGAQERIGVSRQARSYPETGPTDSVENDPAYLSRAIPGFFVGAAGALAGGLLGLAVAGKCNETGDVCEFHGIGELVVGGVIGAIAGSALGASIPIGRALCAQGERFRKGLVGAALGGLVGIGLGAVSTPLGLSAVITVPVGAATEMRKC
jgi:hypothetical protein